MELIISGRGREDGAHSSSRRAAGAVRRRDLQVFGRHAASEHALRYRLPRRPQDRCQRRRQVPGCGHRPRDGVRKKLKACVTFRDIRDAAAEVAVREALHRDQNISLDSPRKHRTRGTAGVRTPAMPHEHVVASACVAQPLAVASAVPVPRPCGYFEWLPHCPVGYPVRMPPIASEELPSPALLPFLNTDI